MWNFLTSLVSCSLMMSALALLLILVEALLTRRARMPSARSMRWAWIAITVALACPLRPDFAALGRLMPAAQPAVDTLRTGVQRFVNLPPPPVRPLPAVADAARATVATAAPAFRPDWALILMAVWLAGVITVLALSLWRHMRLKRTILRWSRPAPDSMRPASGTRVLVSPVVSSPLLMGLFRPAIVLPSTGYAPDELSTIIAHEERHRLNHDILVNCALLAARAVNWFNPLLPLIAREVELKCEQACDEMTLRTQDGRKLPYVEAILSASVHAGRASALTTSFSGGKHTMKRRIDAIYNRKARKLGALITALALLMTVIVPSVIALANEETDASKEPEQIIATSGETLDVGDSALRGGDNPDDVLRDMLTLYLSTSPNERTEDGDETYVISAIAACDAVRAILGALEDANSHITANMMDEIIDMADESAPSVEDYVSLPMLTERTLELLENAPSDFSIERILLMFASGELFPAIETQLARGEDDVYSMLCATLAYEYYNKTKGASMIFDYAADEDLTWAQTAVAEWCEATGQYLFYADPTEDVEPAAEITDYIQPTVDEAYSRMFELTMSLYLDDSLTPEEYVLSLLEDGDITDDIYNALEIYKKMNPDNEDHSTIMLCIATGEINEPAIKRLEIGAYDALSLMSAGWVRDRIRDDAYYLGRYLGIISSGYPEYIADYPESAKDVLTADGPVGGQPVDAADTESVARLRNSIATMQAVFNTWRAATGFPIDR